MRIFVFLKEALPYVLLGVFIVNILYSLKIIDIVGNIFSPVIPKLLGMPSNSVSALIVGFLRKDVAVDMLEPLNLIFKQTVIGCVILSMYFPCVATFSLLIRELGIINMLKSVIIMLISTLIVDILLNLIF